MQPVLLPGNMCDARMWGEGAGTVRALLPALCGKAPIDADLSRDASITAMARRTLAATQGPLLAIGFSMGAIVAVEMAVIAPQRIAGLVLAGYNATADLPDRAARRPEQQARVRAGQLERVLVDELKPHYLAAAHRRDKAMRALLRDMGLRLGPDVFIAQSEALRQRADRVDALPRLTCPVLYLCGEEDRLCPPDWHQRWQAITPGAGITILRQAGHMLPLEQPQAFAAAVQGWLHHNRKDIAA